MGSPVSAQLMWTLWSSLGTCTVDRRCQSANRNNTEERGATTKYRHKNKNLHGKRHVVNHVLSTAHETSKVYKTIALKEGLTWKADEPHNQSVHRQDDPIHNTLPPSFLDGRLVLMD